MPWPDDPVVLGRVANVYGIKGWVKVRSFTHTAEEIGHYSRWWLGSEEKGPWQAYGLAAFKTQGKYLLAQLEGVDSREQAAALLQFFIAVDRTQLPVLSQGEYYWHDLLGLRVVNGRDERLGTVERLFETGANDVLVVRRQQGTLLIPYIRDQVVKSIDLQSGEIRVDWEADYLT